VRVLAWVVVIAVPATLWALAIASSMRHGPPIPYPHNWPR
jgi:hypothetical protein